MKNLLKFISILSICLFLISTVIGCGSVSNSGIEENPLSSHLEQALDKISELEEEISILKEADNVSEEPLPETTAVAVEESISTQADEVEIPADDSTNSRFTPLFKYCSNNAGI